MRSKELVEIHRLVVVSNLCDHCVNEPAPRKESLTMDDVVCTPGSATSNGYISRTKHFRRLPPRLSNVLRSFPSFKTIPSSIGSEFAFGSSRNGQTAREREPQRESDKLTE